LPFLSFLLLFFSDLIIATREKFYAEYGIPKTRSQILVSSSFYFLVRMEIPHVSVCRVSIARRGLSQNSHGDLDDKLLKRSTQTWKSVISRYKMI
jgi:hypothetical protein